MLIQPQLSWPWTYFETWNWVVSICNNGCCISGAIVIYKSYFADTNSSNCWIFHSIISFTGNSVKLMSNRQQYCNSADHDRRSNCSLFLTVALVFFFFLAKTVTLVRCVLLCNYLEICLKVVMIKVFVSLLYTLYRLSI